MFLALFLQLLFVPQKPIIFVKVLKNLNGKLSYTTEGNMAAVYFTYGIVKIFWCEKWKSFKSENNYINNAKNKVCFDRYFVCFKRMNCIFSLTLKLYLKSWNYLRIHLIEWCFKSFHCGSCFTKQVKQTLTYHFIKFATTWRGDYFFCYKMVQPPWEIIFFYLFEQFCNFLVCNIATTEWNVKIQEC